ncbi:hypothetical protein D9M72_563490 [compost metagenome]
MPAEPAPVALTVPSMVAVIAPPVPLPPAVPMYSALSVITRPPPPPSDCSTMAGALLPVVDTVAPALTVALITPPMPVALRLPLKYCGAAARLACPAIPPATPPPPPMDCASTPTAFAPDVVTASPTVTDRPLLPEVGVLTPSLLTLPLVLPEPKKSATVLPVTVPPSCTPPPPLIDWARMP